MTSQPPLLLMRMGGSGQSGTCPPRLKRHGDRAHQRPAVNPFRFSTPVGLLALMAKFARRAGLIAATGGHEGVPDESVGRGLAQRETPYGPI